MDIRFLKHLTSNVGYIFPKHVILSRTPSIDIVSVGIGQVIKAHPIYVPVHGLNSSYHLKKTVCQEGGSHNEVQSDPTFSQLPKKKQKIDEGVQMSFQHPIIKTKTLQLSSSKKGAKKQLKFKIID